MMRKMATMMLGMICGAMAWSAAAAEGGAFNLRWTPFQWGVFPPVQLFGTQTGVYGLRLSTIYSDNNVMYGLDTGVFTGAKEAVGMQIAAANFVTDYAGGIQLALVNANGKDTTGAQLALVNIGGREDHLIEGHTKGAQLGYVNVSNSVFSGVQLAMANLSNWTFRGMQIGLINCNDDAGASQKSTCVQIGIINYNTSGFLLFFPVFNF